MRLSDHVRLEDLAEQLHLGLARAGVGQRHLVDRAVVLREAEGRTVGLDRGVTQVAKLILDGRQLAHAVDQGSVGRQSSRQPSGYSLAERDPPGLEHLRDEPLATDRGHGRQHVRGQAVVVRREKALGSRGDVEDVARASHAVANRLPRDQTGDLERSELLKHAGAAGPHPPRELMRTSCTVAPEVVEDRLAEIGGVGAGSATDSAVAVGSTGAERHMPAFAVWVCAELRVPHPQSGIRGSRPGHPRRLAPRRHERPGALRCRQSSRRRTARPWRYHQRMDLDLSREHGLLRDTIREYMRAEVAPVIDEHEKARRFPRPIVDRLGTMGWLGIPFPEDEGGAGLDTLAYTIAVEEIGRVWGSLGLIVAAHTSLGCGPLHLIGTDAQKQRYLVPMAQGRVLGAYGLTEPGAGSDS